MAEEGWRSLEAAEEYIKTVDVVAPGRREILTIIARLAVETAGEPPVIMDMGCGLGHVTDDILKISPNARVVMTDISGEMLKITRERFKDNQNITVLQHDLNLGLGPGGEMEYDAVISCFALHHIDFANRVRLYTDINKVLKKTGIFINGDLFIADSPIVNDWEFDNYIEWMLVQLREKLGQEYTFAELKAKQLENYQTMGDKPGTIWEMYNDLQVAGFKHIDCMCKYQNLAVLVASNR